MWPIKKRERLQVPSNNPIDMDRVRHHIKKPIQLLQALTLQDQPLSDADRHFLLCRLLEIEQLLSSSSKMKKKEPVEIPLLSCLWDIKQNLFPQAALRIGPEAIWQFLSVDEATQLKHWILHLDHNEVPLEISASDSKYCTVMKVQTTSHTHSTRITHSFGINSRTLKQLSTSNDKLKIVWVDDDIEFAKQSSLIFPKNHSEFHETFDGCYKALRMHPEEYESSVFLIDLYPNKNNPNQLIPINTKGREFIEEFLIGRPCLLISDAPIEDLEIQQAIQNRTPLIPKSWFHAWRDIHQ